MMSVGKATQVSTGHLSRNNIFEKSTMADGSESKQIDPSMCLIFAIYDLIKSDMIKPKVGVECSTYVAPLKLSCF